MSENPCTGCLDAGRCFRDRIYIDCSRRVSFDVRRRREQLGV